MENEKPQSSNSNSEFGNEFNFKVNSNLFFFKPQLNLITISNIDTIKIEKINKDKKKIQGNAWDFENKGADGFIEENGKYSDFSAKEWCRFLLGKDFNGKNENKQIFQILKEETFSVGQKPQYLAVEQKRYSLIEC